MLVPRDRVKLLNARPARPDGELVLYWMIATRRTGWSFALERGGGARRALRASAGGARGAALRLPLGERPPAPLRARRHGRRTRGASPGAGVLYHPYVEPAPGRGQGAARGARRARLRWWSPTSSRRSSCRGWSAAAARRSPVRLRAGRRQRAAAARRGRAGLPHAPTPSAASCSSASAAAPRPFPRRPIRWRGCALPGVAARPGEIAVPLARGARRSCSPARRASSPRCRSITRWPRADARGRVGRGGAGARRVPRAPPRPLRGRAQRTPMPTPTQRALAVPALRPHLGARGASAELMRAARLDPAERLARQRHRQARGLVGASSPLPRRSSTSWSPGASSATTSAATRDDYDRYESLPGGRARRSPSTPRDPREHALHASTSSRRRRTARPALERRPAPARARGPHPQLPAHALGQEDPRVVASRRARRWR